MDINKYKNKKILTFSRSEKARFFEASDIISQIASKKVLILGLGLNQGGVGAARFFAKVGAEIRVSDLKDEVLLKPSLDQLKEFKNIEYVLGQHREEDINWADLIIRNPSLKPENPYLKYAREKGKQVELDMGIFLQFVKPYQIIAVTGTKGKSTTASLIYHVLKSPGVYLTHPKGVLSRHLVGNKVILAGNIGTSVLDIISQITPETLIILEVSSFQLEAFDEHKFGPHYALITNIYPDHLNYYSFLEEYIVSKKLISKNQTKDDYLFLWKDDSIANTKDFLNGISSRIIHFSSDDLPKDFNPLLKGEHNLSNLAASLKVLKQLGVDEKFALNQMAKFKGVEFRMQLIKEWRGVKIYNDTTATMPEATIESLKSFPNCILICGGMNKGLNYDELSKAIDKWAKAVYFIEGEATDNLKLKIKNLKLIKGTYNNLVKLLQAVKNDVKPGDVVLFSPGATSFNLFQNEFDRGRKFNQAVEEVFKERVSS